MSFPKLGAIKNWNKLPKAQGNSQSLDVFSLDQAPSWDLLHQGQASGTAWLYKYMKYTG